MPIGRGGGKELCDTKASLFKKGEVSEENRGGRKKIDLFVCLDEKGTRKESYARGR